MSRTQEIPSVSDAVTLYRGDVDNWSEELALGESFGYIALVGEFRRVSWCKTHADAVMHHLLPEDACRWAVKVNDAKRCVLVDIWQEVVE